MNVSDEVQQLFALCESLLRGQQHIFTAFKHTLDLQMKEHTHTHTESQHQSAGRHGYREEGCERYLLLQVSDVIAQVAQASLSCGQLIIWALLPQHQTLGMMKHMQIYI